ncbi:MAG: energy transducer TonB [Porphyrobacter sp. IPPAS B-1204]|nr:MAG: energy transducer TonB [Porphyrobacter sp. IPPAS B-1204]
MRPTILVLSALSVVLAAAPAAAEPVVLKPSSQWNVDFAVDSCRLVRLFGEGENRHFLSFQQYSPGKGFGLTIAGPGFKKFRSLAKTMISFHDAQAPRETTPFTGTVDEFGTGLIYANLGIEEEPPQDDADPAPPPRPGVPMLDLAQGKQVQFIALRQGKQEVRLETGSLDKAFAVLNQCTLDLVRDWGLDPDRHVTAQTRPRWTNQEVVVRRISREYPSEAARIGEQGIMRMRVIVSAEGMVESCKILKSTQTEELESPACKMMKHARFDPALDAAGVPFRSYFVTSITYQLG